MPRGLVRRAPTILLTAGVAILLSAGLTACRDAPAEAPLTAATATPTPAPTPTATLSSPPPPTPSPTRTPTPTATPSPSAAPTPLPAERPSRTPTPTPTPVRTATPGAATPTPTAAPALTPCTGFECVERATGAFEHRMWETGETIDWTEGAFALETLTGRIHGYRLGTPYAEGPWDEGPKDYRVLSRRWVGARTTDKPAFGPGRPATYGTWRLLLDRETQQVWRWPERALDLAALSDEQVLFQDRNDGSFTLMTREGEVATQFSLHGVEEYYDQHSFFSPDGRTLVISARVGAAHGGEQVYRMPVTASRPELLFEPEPPDGCRVTHVRTNYSGTLPAYGQKGSRTLDSVGWSRNHGDQPRMILVDVYHYCPESDERGSQQLLFSWEGDPLLVDAWTGYAGSILGGPYQGQDPDAQPPCGGSPSPDGRYVAWQEGFPDRHKWHGQYPETRPWNRVVIADADTCEPIFRVLSAYTYQLLWEAQWLANSEGFVVGVLGGHAIARVHPEPKLVRLPALPPGPLWADGPVPAPTGDGRYFAYEFAGVYDSVRDRWISPGFALSTDSQPHARREEFRDWGPVRWGENHEELRYESGDWDRAWLDEGWFGGLYDWTLLPPSLEIPPFDNNLSFVVARTGGCVDLREQPPEQALALDCLPDGTRVSLSGDAWGPAFPHPLSSLDSALVRVRTADGLEGWLPLDYLDHE